MGRTRIKICGIRDAETALAAAELGADALGLVFAPYSPRAITPRLAWEIVGLLPPLVATVGLFVNPTALEVEQIRAECPFDYIQLHGQEEEDLVRACGPRVMKAVRYDALTIEAEFFRWNALSEIDAVLVDGSAGGEGQTLDWNGLAAIADQSEHPLILAGGLTPENVGEAIRIVRPFAVDVSSGVESSRGVKDVSRIARFIEAVRSADAAIR